MKGFLTTKRTTKADFVDYAETKDEIGHSHFEEVHKVQYGNSKMIEKAKEWGFVIDKANDVFVLPSFGAFYSNVDASINTIIELENYYDKSLKCNPYEEVLEKIKKGYIFTIGPAFPSIDGTICKECNGLYCVNYLKIAKEMEKEDNVIPLI